MSKKIIYLGDLMIVAETLASMPGVRLAAWIFEENDTEKPEILGFCRERGIAARSVSSKDSLGAALRNVGEINLGVIANFGIILSAEQMVFSKKGFVNVHLGALPEYPGRYPVQDALKNKEKVLEITLHRVTEDIDAGEIIARKKVAAGKDLPSSLERVTGLVPDILRENLPRFFSRDN